jgi:hypothetical protein
MNTVASKGGHRHFEKDVSLIANPQIFRVILLIVILYGIRYAIRYQNQVIR